MKEASVRKLHRVGSGVIGPRILDSGPVQNNRKSLCVWYLFEFFVIYLGGSFVFAPRLLVSLLFEKYEKNIFIEIIKNIRVNYVLSWEMLKL
jgi:hypothetical protein